MVEAMLTLQNSLFSCALAVYLTASVFVAAVRWGYRCQPYARHMDYYFPAWKAVIFCFLSNLLMAPAIFCPDDTDALLQLRLLLFLASPFFCALLIFRYFGKALGVTNWRWPVYILSVPFAIVALSVTVLAIFPGTQMDRDFCCWFFFVVGMLAAAFLICFVTAVFMVARELRRLSEENYSNPDDFPHKYASRILWIPLIHLTVSFVSALVGTPAVLSAGLLVLSVLSLIFLISILPRIVRWMWRSWRPGMPRTSLRRSRNCCRRPVRPRSSVPYALSWRMGRLIWTAICCWTMSPAA